MSIYFLNHRKRLTDVQYKSDFITVLALAAFAEQLIGFYYIIEFKSTSKENNTLRHFMNSNLEKSKLRHLMTF